MFGFCWRALSWKQGAFRIESGKSALHVSDSGEERSEANRNLGGGDRLTDGALSERRAYVLPSILGSLG